MKVHDLAEPTLDDLEGYEIRLNVPGGAHFEGTFKDGKVDVKDADGQRPKAGTYELSFREAGTTAWANDARLATVER